MNFLENPNQTLIIAQTLIDLSILGFVILIALIGIPQARSLLILRKDMIKAFELLFNFYYIIIAKITNKVSVAIFSFSALILIISGVLGLLYFIFCINIFLIVGCFSSLISLSLMFTYIFFVLISTNLNKYFITRSQLEKVIEYLQQEDVN